MPQPVVNKRKNLMQKQMPTMIGIFVLVGALVSGLLLFKNGTGVFAPRATPQTTPKNVRLTNVTDTSFTVSFFTDEPTTSFVKYGSAENKLSLQASDDRTQLSGVAGNYNVHHITVRSLKPNTAYFYVLGTSSERTTFDNQGKPFTVTTAASLSSAPDSTMIYGNLYNQDGTPAEGSVVYLTMSEAGPLSSLVRNTGGWGISLATARNAKGTASAIFNKDTAVNFLAQGKSFSQTLSYQTTIASAQPVADLKFGAASASTVPAVSPSAIPTLTTGQTTGEASNSAFGKNLANLSMSSALEEEPSNNVTDYSDSDVYDDSPSEVVSDYSMPIPTSVPASSVTVAPTKAPTSTSASTSATLATEVDLTVKDTTQLEHVAQPLIKGEAKPNVVVTIEIHSDNQIETTVTADKNGDFELDLATLGKNLEPGEHTVTYSYTDPTTGKLVTTTKTFYVGEKTSTTSNQLALASTTYGSGNPYSSPTPTQKVTPTVKLSPTVAMSSRSAVVSTSSGTFSAGSFEVTLALILAGLFFITGGIWSWWLAVKLEE